MRTFGIGLVAAIVLMTSSAGAVQPQVAAASDSVVVHAQAPAGTAEFEAYQGTVRQTLKAYVRNLDQLFKCKSWACLSSYFARIDRVLTRGIRWMYTHPALPCYQAQQQRVTKGFQELRGAIRMWKLRIETGKKWRIKVALNKLRKAEAIFENLPAATCPA
jgi:hypothetical protein